MKVLENLIEWLGKAVACLVVGLGMLLFVLCALWSYAGFLRDLFW